MMHNDKPDSLGQQSASASPAAITESREKSARAARRTFKQRMTAASVGAIAIALLKLFHWLSTPAPPALPANINFQAYRVLPPLSPELSSSGRGSTYLPPGINLSGQVAPPNWGPVPNFPQTGTSHPNTSR